MFNKFNKLFNPTIIPMIIPMIIPLWGSLGMYRGHKYYINKYNQDKKYNPKLNYYYTTDTLHCIWGVAFYIFPPTAIYSSLYEIYELEKSIRGIEKNIRGIDNNDE